MSKHITALNINMSTNTVPVAAPPTLNNSVMPQSDPLFQRAPTYTPSLAGYNVEGIDGMASKNPKHRENFKSLLTAAARKRKPVE